MAAITARKGLVFTLFLGLLYLLYRNASSPSDIAAFGSARAGLTKSLRPSHEATALQGSKSAPAPGRRPKKQIPLSDIARKPLRQRLQYYFPYELESRFPAYVWQTWKVTPGDGEFREEYRPLEASWTTMHPGFVHEVLTDEMCLGVLKHLYSALPDVIRAYEALPRPVLKADFFRYLILLARGGIYTDIDTQALRSAIDWVPVTFPRTSYGLVIGIEADPDRPDWAEWYSRRIQFCQWTIQAKPGHPALVEIVATIVDKALQKQRDGTLSTETSSGVVEFTGPAVWTDAVFGYLNDERYSDAAASSPTAPASSAAARNVTWRDFTGLTTPKRVSDVVVLPITAFSPGIETMGAGPDDDPMAMVKHYFDGTWKPESERHIGEKEQ